MSRVIAPFAQFFDSAGDPLEDGWLTFLVSNTNNSLKDTYSDSAESLPNSNPLQLSADGRCPDVFGQGAYRVVLSANNPVTKAPGEQIAVFDPVLAEAFVSNSGNNFDEWDSTIYYQVGNIVFRSGVYYRSLVTNNFNNDPVISTSQWEKIAFLRYWDTSITYSLDDVVVHNSAMYFSLQNSNTGNTPFTSPSWWAPVGNGALLLNWEEYITTFRPLFSGYDIGDTTHLLGDVFIGDTGKLYVGASQEMEIYRSTAANILNSDSGFYIGNVTSHNLHFMTNNIIRWVVQTGGAFYPYSSDTYSIGLGSNTVKSVYVGETGKIFLGASQELSIYYDGSISHIKSSGYLQIETTTAIGVALASNSVIRWILDSVGDFKPNVTDTYNIGGSSNLVKNIYMGEAGRLYFGASQEFFIYYDGANSRIVADDGPLYIGTGNATAVIFKVNNTDVWQIQNDGDLAPITTDTYKIGDASHTIRDLYVGGTGIAYFGASQEGKINFDGAGGNFIIRATTGQLRLTTESSEFIWFLTNNTFQWALESSGNFRPNLTDTLNIGLTSKTIKNIYIGEAGKLYLGASQDLEIYHDGTSSYIANIGSTFVIGTHSSNHVYFRTNTTNRWVILNDGTFYPYADDSYPLGDATHRPSRIWVANDPVDADEVANKNYVDNNLVTIRKNELINGNFDFWQRNTTQTTNGYGADDKWKNSFAGGTTYQTITQQSFTPGQTDVPNNPTYFSRSAVGGAAATSDYIIKQHYLEDVARYSGQTVTISFWAKADASRTIALEMAQTFGTGGSTAVLGLNVQSYSLTTLWQYFTTTYTIPSVSGKTIGANNGLAVIFWFSGGSDYNSRNNSLGFQTGTFDLAQVKFELGSTATVCLPVNQAEELVKCQRYYCNSYTNGVVPGTANNSCFLQYFIPKNTSISGPALRFPVEMRTIPTMTIYSPVSGAAGYVYDQVGAVDVPVTNIYGLGTVGLGYLAFSVSQVDGDSFVWQYEADADL